MLTQIGQMWLHNFFIYDKHNMTITIIYNI